LFFKLDCSQSFPLSLAWLKLFLGTSSIPFVVWGGDKWTHPLLGLGNSFQDTPSTPWWNDTTEEHCMSVSNVPEPLKGIKHLHSKRNLKSNSWEWDL